MDACSPEAGGAAMLSGLGTTLRRLRERLVPLREREPAALRALEVLERDLLPRSAGGDVYMVCGVVGPNNAGKSALFNALVGREISPSLPAGGATRRLVGAAGPALLERLTADPAAARFHLRPTAGPAGALQAALRPAADPAELLVVEEAALPAHLLLIDTPDFDSILKDNRVASESLLAVADLVIAVVTRHSYQNREVVQFLESWLQHGRPWMLVYNEAMSEAVARAHLAKLVADVGTPPLATFWAPHNLAVQEGTQALRAVRVDADRAAAAPLPADGDLRTLLFDEQRVAAVKARAFRAALARLRSFLEQLASSATAAAAHAREVLAAAAARAATAGHEVAAAAMPAGPFVDAFRTVLDRRSNPLSRGWRAFLRGVRTGIEDIARMLRGRHAADAAARERATLEDVERAALARVWPGFWEELLRDLGPEARHGARRGCPTAVTALLDRDLVMARSAAAQAQAARLLSAHAADLDEFRQHCERLIEQAIAERGFDLDIQAAADLATLAPVALATAVIVKTGGLGIDLAVAGGGAVSTFLMEKYSHVLGSGILADARSRWTHLRGAQLSALLVDAALEHAAPALRARIDDGTSLAAELRELRERLS
jgi:hypothetical protein